MSHQAPRTETKEDEFVPKPKLHPRNLHRDRYDFKQLIKANPELKQYLIQTPYAGESIDFFNPEAVKALNKSLLKHFYGLSYWDIPDGYLCPPVPGRADYIHHAADLLAKFGTIPTGPETRILDIGTGANCIYPILGIASYGWSFVGAELDQAACESAQAIKEQNPNIDPFLEIRPQSKSSHIFKGIIRENERFDLTICNPPFHASQAEALAGTERKLKNLGAKDKTVLNFGGKANELWCEGGEDKFVQNLIFESRDFAKSCYWFSTLISKKSRLKRVYALLKTTEAIQVKTIPMGQGNKSSQLVAWTFLNKEERNQWIKDALEASKKA